MTNKNIKYNKLLKIFIDEIILIADKLLDLISLLKTHPKKTEQYYKYLSKKAISLKQLSAFIGLENVTKLSDLLQQKAMSLLGVINRNDQEALELVKEVLIKIKDVCDSVDLLETSGDFADAQGYILKPGFKHNVICYDLIKDFALNGFYPGEDIQTKNLLEENNAFRKIDLPSNVMSKADKSNYVSLVYFDVASFSSIKKLMYIISRLKQENKILLHGALWLNVNDANSYKYAMSYYLVLNTKTSTPRFMSKMGINKYEVVNVYKSPDKAYKERIKKAAVVKDKAAEAGEESLLKAKFFSRIGFRLIFIISVIILLSLNGMIYLASYFFLGDTKARIEENNHKISEVTARNVEQSLLNLAKEAQLLHTSVSIISRKQREDYLSKFFTNTPEILYTTLVGPDFRKESEFFNDAFILSDPEAVKTIQAVVDNDLRNLIRSENDEILVDNISYHFNTPVILISAPFITNEGAMTLLVISKGDYFQDIARSRGAAQSVIVNNKGVLLGSGNLNEIIEARNITKVPVFDYMVSSPLDNGQIQYTYEDKDYLGSFKTISFGKIGVITSIENSIAFEAVNDIQRRNLYLMVMFLSFSIMILYFFSKSLTGPIHSLVGAARKIETGDYTVNLKIKRRDEVGILTRTFNEMSSGLEEREKIKSAFGKFVNKEIAEQVTKGEIKLGGERKQATIFFSDIRSFTAISEKLEPEEVVGFLNEYMTLMVDCVNRTHGVVDKYIGDAIMAVWGTPVSHGNDAENAVNGALMMRKALIEFNKGRGDDKQPIIRIGCGMNTGPVLAGQIGSSDRMEYTVIGDAVNLASRIESINKALGTDVLISQDTYNLLKEIFDVVPMQKIKVKGKSESQQIYAVLGRFDDPDRPKNLQEMRDFVGIVGDFDSGNVDLDKEEQKFELLETK